MAPIAIAQKRMMVQILLYRRLIGIDRPLGVMASVGDRVVVRVCAVWLMALLILQGNRLAASTRHYTLHFDSIKGYTVIRCLLIVLACRCALKRFPIIVIAGTALFSDEALAEAGIFRNPGHAGLEGILD